MKIRLTMMPAWRHQSSQELGRSCPARQQHRRRLRSTRPARAPCTQVRRRARGGDPRHVLARLAQRRVVHRHRLRPAEQEACRPRRAGSRAAPRWCRSRSMWRSGLRLMRPCGVRRHVAEVARDIAVRRLVQRDREQHREGVDGERLQYVVDVHLLRARFYQTASTAKGASEPLALAQHERRVAGEVDDRARDSTPQAPASITRSSWCSSAARMS